MSHPNYVANAALAIERFGSEAVCIDIDKGLYYSIVGSALDVFDAFRLPQKPGDVIDHLCTHLDGADRAALQQAFDQLVAHGLIIQSDSSTISALPALAEDSVFVTPSISVFDDLADLIALDPVHEVDNISGWPVRPPSFPDVG